MGENAEQPKQQARPGISPISGTAPPKEHRWKPGQTGNPRGYSYKRRMEDAFERVIEERALQGKLDTFLESLFGRVEAGERGWNTMAQYLIDRAMGPAAKEEKTEVSGPVERVVVVRSGEEVVEALPEPREYEKEGEKEETDGDDDAE